MSGGGKTSTSTSSVQIPPEVMARYNAINQYAAKVAETPYQPYQGQFVAPMTETQTAALANVNQAAGQAQPYFTGATESLLQGQQAATPYYGAAMQAYGGAYGLGAQLGQESYGALQGAQAAAQPYGQAATGLALAGTQAVNPSYLGQGAINQYMSPYLSSVVGSTMEAMNQQNQQQQSQLTSDAIRTGAFGGDRAGVAAANLAYKQNLANQQTLANLYNTGYGQALTTAAQQQGLGLGAQQANRAALQAGADRMANIGQQQFVQGAATAGQLAGLGQQQFTQGLTAGQQIAGLGQGIYGMGEKTAQNLAALGTGAQDAALRGASAQLAAGTQQQQTQQAQNAALYNQFLQQQGYPFQVAQFLANIGLGTGAQSGSTTTTTQPASFFSDKRLKENVHQVGETFDGQPIYRYNYKGQRGTQIGLIAQDVERKHPEAVGVAGGYKTVDYDRATEDAAHRGHFAYGGASMGGGVVPERAGEGFAEGGMPDYFAQILANARKGQIGAGLGGQGQGLNIPTQSSMPSGRPVVASPPPAQPNTSDDLRYAAANLKAIEGLFGSGKAALLGSAATDKSAETSGFAGAGGKWDPSKGWLGGLGAAHGGAINGYADGGEANDEDASPYGVRSFVPNKPLNISTPKTAPAAPGQSRGVGSDIMDAAKFASSIAGFASLFSDKRLKENIHQIGKTFDGQPVYRYNYKGHPETQIGLIAQDVEHKHPEAVGLAGGYKTVDYGRATEGAAHRGHFAYGGIAPRHGFQAGGQPEDSDDVNRLLRPEWRQRQYDRTEAQRQRELSAVDPSAGPIGGANFSGPLVGDPASFSAPSFRQTGLVPDARNIERGRLSLPGVDTDQPSFENPYANYNASLVDPSSVYHNIDRFNPRPGLGAASASAPAPQGPPAAQARQTEGPAPGLASGTEPYAPQQASEQSSASQAAAPAGGVAPGPASRTAPSAPPADSASAPAVTPRPVGGVAPARQVDANALPPNTFPARADATGLAPQAPVGQATQPAGVATGAMPSPAPEKPDEGSKGSWFSRNQDWLVPLLTGVGTMAASPSRYLGAALLQGVGGAAATYGQREFKERELNLTERQRNIAERTQDQNLLQMLLNRRLMYTQSQQGIPLELEQQISNLSNKVAGYTAPSGTGAPAPFPPTGRAGRGSYTDAAGAPQQDMVRNQLSSAAGPAQFLDETWLKVMQNNPATRDLVANKSQQEILAMRASPELNMAATEYYAQNNAPVLRNNNIPVNDDTLRMAHGFGPAGAVKVIQSPNERMETLFPPDQKGNMNPVLAANPAYIGKTAGQVSELLLGRPVPQGWGPDAGGPSPNYASYVIARESGGARPAAPAVTPAVTPAAAPAEAASMAGLSVSPRPEIRSAMAATFRANGVGQDAISNFQTSIPSIANDLPKVRDPRYLTEEGNRLADAGNPEAAKDKWHQASEVLKDMHVYGRYMSVDGTVKNIPGFFSNVAETLRVPKNIEFFGQLAKDQYERGLSQGVIDKAADIFTQFRTGADASIRARIDGMLKSVLPTNPFSGSAASYETIAKEAQNTIANKLAGLGLNAGHTDYQRQAAAGATISPNSDPDTNKNIMAQMQAGLEYANMFARDAQKAARDADMRGQVFDKDNFTLNWEQQNRGLVSKLADEAAKNLAVRGARRPSNPTIGTKAVFEPGWTDAGGNKHNSPAIFEWQTDRNTGSSGWLYVKMVGEK